jgi:hypothetical protein
MCVWNVRGLTDVKKDCDTFCKHLYKYDIFSLVETWIGPNSNIELEGYKCFHFHRDFVHRRARRKSGGIVVYVKTQIVQGVSLVKHFKDNFVWIKLDKTYFCLDKDVYFCFAYIPPEGSSIYNHVDVNLHDVLQCDVEYFNNIGHVFVGGDLNGRIGGKPDFVEQDFVSLDESDVYICDQPLRRASMDSKVNTFGTLLLDLCKGAGMRVLNGRCGDTSNSAKFTYVCERGESVVDYVLSSIDSMHLIGEFELGDLSEHSDHVPISLTLHTGPASARECGVQVGRDSCSGVGCEHKAIIKWRWDCNYKYSLREALTLNIDGLNNVITSVEWNDNSSIGAAVETFTSKLQDICKPFFGKPSAPHTDKSGFKGRKQHSAPWFDTECFERKKQYLDALSCFNRSRTHDSKHQMYTKKKMYKKVVRKRKMQYDLEQRPGLFGSM